MYVFFGESESGHSSKFEEHICNSDSIDSISFGVDTIFTNGKNTTVTQSICVLFIYRNLSAIADSAVTPVCINIC